MLFFLYSRHVAGAVVCNCEPGRQPAVVCLVPAADKADGRALLYPFFNCGARYTEHIAYFFRVAQVCYCVWGVNHVLVHIASLSGRAW